MGLASPLATRHHSPLAAHKAETLKMTQHCTRALLSLQFLITSFLGSSDAVKPGVEDQRWIAERRTTLERLANSYFY